MNHTYRVVWNQATSSWQAVCETARRCGKSGRASLKLVAVSGVAALVGVAQAQTASLPTGGQVVAGSAAISQSGSSMTITQGSAKAAINWQGFSVGSGNTVNFVQPSASAVALNRVLGSDVSLIQGAINANGQIFLVNPNGVLFTPTAQVNVGSIIASTLNISTADFMAGNYRFSGDSTNAVVNQGNIVAQGNGGKGGSIALIAARVINDGSLSANAGGVAMAAASDVTLDLGGPVKLKIDKGVLDALVANGGGIQADGGTIFLTAKAVDALSSAVVNNTGVIRAQTLSTGEKGDIRLIADMQSGVANIGGKLDASAPNGGDGGFIDTSAALVNVNDSVSVTTLAAKGATGQWLIDPNDYTIAASGGNITGAALSTQLNTTSVTISTATQGTAGNGDILVNDAVTKTGTSGATTLTLQAERNVRVNQPITSTGSALNITLSAANAPTATVGGVDIAANLNSNGGDILIGGAGGSVAGAQTVRNGIGYALNLSGSEAAVKIGALKSVLSGGGNITINGYSTTNPSGSGDGTGVHLFSQSTVDTGNYANGSTAAPVSGGNVYISGYATNGTTQFGIKFEAPGGQADPKTRVTTSPVNGVIVLDGNNPNDSRLALGLSNAGNQGNLYFGAYSTADLLVLINGNASIATFQTTPPNSGCRVGYPNCGTFSVPGANGSYPNATFNAVVWSSNNLYISGTVGGSKVYDGTTNTLNLTGTGLTCSGVLAGCSQGSLTTAGIWSFNTSSPNVGSYSVISPSVRTTTIGGTTYQLGYFFLTGTYSITPATASLSAVKTFDGTASFTAAQITARGIGVETLSLVGAGLATAVSPDVADNSTNYLTALGGLALANGTSGTQGLASNYVLPSLSARSANNTALINPAGVTILGTAGTRIYNGTAVFDASSLTLSGVAPGTVNLSGSATVASPNVGTYTQWASSSLALDNINYTLVGGSVLATITPAPLGVYARPAYNGTQNFATVSGTPVGTTGSVVGGGTVQVAGLVPGELLSGFTLDSRNVLDATKVTGVTISGTNTLASNYVLNSNVLAAAGAGGPPVAGAATSGNQATNDAAISKAALGVSVAGQYNGTTGYTTAGGATIQTNGLVNGETLTGVTVNSPNVFDNATNRITAFTGGTANLDNYQISATQDATTAGAGISTTHNKATLTRAPLGVTVAGTYNGTETMSTATGATITGYGLLGQDSGASLTTATMSSKNVGDNATNRVVGLTGTGTFDDRNYVLDGVRNPTGGTGTAGTAPDGSGATNTATLTPAAITVTPADKTKVYGTADPTFTYSVTGLLGSDSLTGALGRDPGENVSTGPYTIRQGTLGNPNYSLTIAPATLTITPATLTYVADPATMNAGSPLPTFTGTVTGFVRGDTQGSATTGTLLFASSATSNSPPGAYPILGSGLTANFGNYVFVQAPANLDAFDVDAASPATPPNPVAVPAFIENGAQAFSAPTTIDFGGLNYVAVQGVPGSAGSGGAAAGGVSGGASTGAGAAAPAGGVSSGTGAGAGTAASAGSATGANVQSISSGGASSGAGQAAVSGSASSGSDQTAASSGGSSGSGSGSTGRRPASEVNVNNVAISSAAGPLDVFLVNGGVNLENVRRLNAIGN